MLVVPGIAAACRFQTGNTFFAVLVSLVLLWLLTEPSYIHFLGFCRMASQEFGLNEEVLDILTQYVGGTTSEILVN